MKSHFLAALLCMLLLPGCAVYRVDVQQGNEITAKMLTELKRGMSKREVSKVLGLPLINDPFHIDRWDYYFSFKKGRTGEAEQQFATLWFTDDALSDIESSLIDSLSDDLLDDDSVDDDSLSEDSLGDDSLSDDSLDDIEKLVDRFTQR